MPSGPVYGASYGEPISFLLQQQDQEEVSDKEAEALAEERCSCS